MSIFMVREDSRGRPERAGGCSIVSEKFRLHEPGGKAMRLFARRQEKVAAPQVGEEAPEFNLPGAHGGQLRLSMRTVRGPVVVAFYRPWSEEDVAYFKGISEKEDEINLASGSVVGIGIAEPDEAREFVRASGMKSYVLYDYVHITTPQWGLLEKDKEHGAYSRPAVFIVGPDHKVAHAWLEERPAPEELLAKVSEITGLPKKPEDEEKLAAEGKEGAPKKKLSPEEREKIKAERRAARESGQSVKTPPTAGEKPAGEGAPKKLSAEERERIKAERRAAREAGKSLKTPETPAAGKPSGEKPAGEAPKKLSAEERERIKAERRALREEGKSVKSGGTEKSAETPEEPEAAGDKAGEQSGEAAPKKLSREERERIKAERRALRESGKSVKKEE
jgi:peroxiredoxin